jgi:hypothetical protein
MPRGVEYTREGEEDEGGEEMGMVMGMDSFNEY